MNRSLKHCVFCFPILFFSFAAALSASTSIPAGTILPVSLNSTISSTKCKPGQIITARVMQDVPLGGGSYIRAGAKVIGHVLSVTPASNSSPASVSLKFDTLETRGQKIPIATNLRAIASFVAVDQAQIPVMGPDRGTPQSAWTTVQIGGDNVYRGGGPVDGPEGKVGEPVFGGVLSRVDANPERGCRGVIDANDRPQALWVFSSDACGAYNLPNVNIRETGRSDPDRRIALESVSGQLNIHAGAGMLLRVNGSTDSGA